jgi:nitrogen PTS system EIIA component
MYLNIVELAESFGVEESSIESWARDEGLPFVLDRGRLLFDRVQAAAWASSRGMTAKVGFLAPAAVSAGHGRGLGSLLRRGGIWRDVAAEDVLEIFEHVLDGLPGASPRVRRLLARRLRAHGGVNWAPVGGGLAMPHLRAPAALGYDSGAIALLFLTSPIPLNEAVVDSTPVDRLLFFVAPSPRMHLEMLGSLSRALTSGALRSPVRDSAADAEIFDALSAAETDTASEGAMKERP